MSDLKPSFAVSNDMAKDTYPGSKLQLNIINVKLML